MTKTVPNHTANAADDTLAAGDAIDPARVPRHIAIIMDGNGRWAQERGAPRLLGHHEGAKAVRRTLDECGKLGVEVLTLFSFSSENWRRPRDEVDGLMSLYRESLAAHRAELVEKNIRFIQIGRRDGMPADVLAEVDATLAATAGCTGPTLCLAVNYGARAELVDAVRTLARRAAAGELNPDTIDEAAIDGELYTAGLPELDLLIRTGGDMRVSNFLLWQLSYAELHVTPVQWPDFGPEHLRAAVADFAARSRRFGGVDAG